MAGFCRQVNAQQVANYSTGTPGQENYEEFSFWVRDHQRSTIDYTYGINRKSLRLTYAGKKTSSFQVRFANRLVLTLTPRGNTLLVTDSKGTYRKVFLWKYEGPENGVGTFCTPCAKDEKEAMKLIQSYYLK